MKGVNSMTEQSTFSWGEPPASPSVSPDSEADWMTLVGIWPSSFFDFFYLNAHPGCFGKMFRESFQLTRERRSAPSSGSWGNAGMGGPTECLTLNISEFPNGAVVSSLSDILETGDLPYRYFLSAKACRGILRRADRRGKALHPPLRAALQAVADSVPIST